MARRMVSLRSQPSGPDMTAPRCGMSAELISQVATEGRYDLVVLGHRGHFLRDHLLGSTADRVAEHAPCPVMIVR